MTLFVIAFVSGVLTILAPCILPVLPVILGVSAIRRTAYAPYIVIASLALSVVVFSIVLKTTTLFIVIPPDIWMYVSGSLFALFGITLLFPEMWRATGIPKVESFFSRCITKGKETHSFLGYVLIGLALGPIFSTCSPTYFVILGTILPVHFWLGVFYVGVYTLGLALALILIVSIGNRYVPLLGRLAHPDGLFKRVLGLLFVCLGVVIALGLMAQFEVWLLDVMPFDVTKIEHTLLLHFFYD